MVTGGSEADGAEAEDDHLRDRAYDGTTEPGPRRGEERPHGDDGCCSHHSQDDTAVVPGPDPPRAHREQLVEEDEREDDPACGGCTATLLRARSADRGGGRPARRAAGEEAAAEEGALERVVAVHAAAAEPGDLARGVQARAAARRRAAAPGRRGRCAGRRGSCAVRMLSRTAISGPLRRVEELVRLGHPHQLVAAVAAVLADEGDLGVLAVGVVELAVALDDGAAQRLLGRSASLAGDLVHAGDEVGAGRRRPRSPRRAA